MTAKNSSNKV